MRAYEIDGRFVYEAENDHERIAHGQMLASDVVTAARALAERIPASSSAVSGYITLPALEAKALRSAVDALATWGCDRGGPWLQDQGGWTLRAMNLHWSVVDAAVALSNCTTMLREGGLATATASAVADLKTRVDELHAWVMPARATGT